jgi:hypothetical protein
MRVEAHTPMAAPTAPLRFMKGNVMASPEMAVALTPCPMNIESAMLYNDEAVMAIMAGVAYCTSSLPTGFVPNSNVACLLSISDAKVMKKVLSLEFREENSEITIEKNKN